MGGEANIPRLLDLGNNLIFRLNLVILHSEVTSSTQPSYKLSRGYKHSQNRASDLYSIPSLSVNICSTTVRRKGTSRTIAQNSHESILAERNVSILSAPRRQGMLLINVGKIPRTRRIGRQIEYLVSRKIQVKQVQSKYSFNYNTR